MHASIPSFCALALLSLPATSRGAQPPVPTFRAVEIDSRVAIGYGVAVADVNGDKLPDILLADKNHIVWYENPSWSRHVIAERLTELDHVCIAAADLDGDGRAEVAAGAGWNPGDTAGSGSVHYLVAASDRAQPWTPVKLHHEPTVHRMRWIKNSSGSSDLLVAPLHGRGNKGGQGVGVKVLAYRKPLDSTTPWTTQLVDDSFHQTHNFDPIQWDTDPEDEVLLGGREGIVLLDRQAAGWRRTLIADGTGGGAGEVRAGRLPGGRRLIAAIAPMHGNTLVIYTQPEPTTTGTLWNRQVLDESLVDGHALACGDVLGVGSDQVVAGWRAMNRPGTKVGVRLYVPLDPEGKRWTQHMIDDNTMACEDLVLADLNQDQRLDIVAAGRATKNLKVYWNEGGARTNK